METHTRVLGTGLGARSGCEVPVLAPRNEDCQGVLASMARMEARFNAKFGYAYVFLNNAPFSAGFVNRQGHSLRY